MQIANYKHLLLKHLLKLTFKNIVFNCLNIYGMKGVKIITEGLFISYEIFTLGWKVGGGGWKFDLTRVIIYSIVRRHIIIADVTLPPNRTWD